MFEGVSTAALIIYVSILLLALILLTLLVLLAHSGLFRAVDDVGAGKPPFKEMIIAYKFQKGPYNQSGQIFTEAACIAPGNKALGIYYDAPCKVEPSNTRYVVGSVLSEGSAPVDEEMVKRFTDQGYKILHLPEIAYAVQTKFPHITTLSILIAVHKAYPRLHDYIQEKKLCACPFIEYYDGKTIHFVAPLSKQDQFCVPECEQEAGGDQPTPDWDTTVLSTSHSSVEESQLSQLDDDESVLGPDQLDTTQTDSVVADAMEDGEDGNSNGNNSEVQINSDKETNEEEQASDDSSSSFEVLKNEPTE